MANPLENLAVKTAPDGTVAGAWVANDGTNDRVAYAERNPVTGQWSEQVWLSAEGADVPAYALDVDDHGNTTVLYADIASGGALARTKLTGQATWSEPTQLVPGGDSINAVAATTAPGGRTAFAWSYSSGGEAGVAVVVRNADATDWSSPERLDQASGQLTRSLTLDYNATGDGSLVYFTNVGSDTEVRGLSFDHASSTWSAPVVIAPTDGDNAMIHNVIGNDGQVAAIWANGSVSAIHAAATVGGVWQAAEQLNTGPDPMQVMPSIGADSSGRFLAAWQSINNTFSDATAYTSVFSAGSWSDAELLPGGQHGGAPTILSNEHDDVVLLRAGNGDAISFAGEVPLSVHSWNEDTGEWSAGRQIAGATAIGMRNLPRGTVDEFGNVVALWSTVDGSDYPVKVSAADRSAPVISAVSVPASAKVGASVNASATVHDLWSATTVDWEFGDGGSDDGASVSHTFAAPGNYTVTVTATDAAGNERESTRQISVTAAAAPQPPAPADDDDEDTVVEPIKPPAKPPVVNAPVIEAKLAGKTVTYNAKLSLKSGQSCSGTVTATFTFGNKRYTSKLKLKKVGTACRATGKTTLKKSPSARTKITIKLSGKQVKTRSLSTKRG